MVLVGIFFLDFKDLAIIERYITYPHQGCGGSDVYNGNIGQEAGICLDEAPCTYTFMHMGNLS